MSFHKKYLVQKCLTGGVLILLGCWEKIFPATADKLIYPLLLLYAAGMLWSIVKKSETEDERAVENKLKAKAHLYNLFLILVLVNSVFQRLKGRTLAITGGIILVMFGLLQLGEYYHFMKFEKGSEDE